MTSIRKREWTSRGQSRSAWLVDYFDQAGKRHVKTFATKKEAEAWRVTASHEVSQGTHTPTSTSATVTEATERWIANCEAEGLEHSTIKQRRGHLVHHIAPFIGREKLSTLTAPRVYQFDTDLRAAGRSLAMRRKVLTNLKTILSFAQTQGLVAQNVARGIKLKGENQRHTGKLTEGVDFPTKTEIKTLIDNAPARWRPFIITAVFTGLRASEVRGLRWQDVDLDAGIIHVRQRADAWRKIGPPKAQPARATFPLCRWRLMRFGSSVPAVQSVSLISCFPTAPATSRATAIFSSASGTRCNAPVQSPTIAARRATVSTHFATPQRACSSPI
jgi:integrase